MAPPDANPPPTWEDTPQRPPHSSVGKIHLRSPCSARLDDGRVCKGTARHGSTLCRWHSPPPLPKPSRRKDTSAKALIANMLEGAKEGRGQASSSTRGGVPAGVGESETETPGWGEGRLQTPTTPVDTVTTALHSDNVIVTSSGHNVNKNVTLPLTSETEVLPLATCQSSPDANTVVESTLESAGVEPEGRPGVWKTNQDPQNLLRSNTKTNALHHQNLETRSLPLSNAPVDAARSSSYVRATPLLPAGSRPTVPAYSQQLEGLQSEGPRYELRDTRFRKAVEKKRGRLDLMDLREELAVMEALAEACINGLNPWHMKEILRTIANAKGVEKAGLQKIAEDCLNRLGRDIPAGTVLELVKEIRTLSKTLVDIEISMKKAVTQERMNRIIVELVQIVRKHVTTDQMSEISKDFVASKDMMV